MNNYISIDKISAVMIATLYLGASYFIFNTVHTLSAVIFIIVYNIIFLFILYKFKLSKNYTAALVILMVLSTILYLMGSKLYTYINFFISILLSFSNIYIIVFFIDLYSKLKNIYKYNYIYINKNKFKPRPLLLLFIYNFYSILTLPLLYILISLRINSNDVMSFYNLLSVANFVISLILLSYIYLFYILLYKYKSAFIALSLSRNRKIHVSSLFNQNSTDIYELFKNQVEPYVYYAHYNEENNVITFDDEDDIIKSNENNEVLECSLDKSIAFIKSLLENENSHEIAGILKSIIDKLNKINNMHQEKHQFNKYIHHINERYIPYIKSIVQAYYNNMQLDLELTKTMQEKIILSLEKINDTFEKSVQEMYNKNMLELESYMQAMDIMLNYKSAGSKA